MKYIITERQFRLLNEEDAEKPVAPKKIKKIHYSFFNDNWYELQDYLNRNETRKKTPYILRGDVHLRGVDVITLGSLVGVEGNLDLTNNKTIESLGNLQYVKGNLDLYGTLIESLENLQSVVGDLNLYDSKIESLGNLQSVGGFLNLYDSKIESLGNLQSVGGYLYLRRTPLSQKMTIEDIRNIPNLTVEGNIYL